MKSAEEWYKEIQSWPRHSEHKMIRAIQADALRHAAGFSHASEFHYLMHMAEELEKHDNPPIKG